MIYLSPGVAAVPINYQTTTETGFWDVANNIAIVLNTLYRLTKLYEAIKSIIIFIKNNLVQGTMIYFMIKEISMIQEITIIIFRRFGSQSTV